MGSADWMPRNLDKRVEIIFPVEDGKLKKEAKHILDIQLGDNVKARILKEDGTYCRVNRRGNPPLNAQEYFCEEATRRGEKRDVLRDDRVFYSGGGSGGNGGNVKMDAAFPMNCGKAASILSVSCRIF